MPSKRQPKRKAVTWATARAFALELPDAEESTSYGTPAIKVNGKLFVRLREEGDVIVVRIEPADRVQRMKANPDAFFITDHYANFPYMLIRLSAVRDDDLRELIANAWRIVGA